MKTYFPIVPKSKFDCIGIIFFTLLTHNFVLGFQQVSSEPACNGKDHYILAGKFQQQARKNAALYDSALYYCDLAQACFKQERNLDDWLRTHIKANVIYRAQQKYGIGSTYINNVLEEAWSASNKDEFVRLATLHLHNGFNYYKIGDYTQSISFYEKSLELLDEACPDKGKYNCFRQKSATARFILHPLSLAYLKVEEYQAAINLLPDWFLKEFEEEVKNSTDGDAFFKLLTSKAQAQLRFGTSFSDTTAAAETFKRADDIQHKSLEQKIKGMIGYARSRDQVKKPEEAEDLLKKAIAYGKKENAGHFLENAYLFIGYIYRDQRKLPEAKLYADSALMIAKEKYKVDKHAELADNYFLYARIRDLQGRDSEAWDYYQRSLQCLLPKYNIATSKSLPVKAELIPSFELVQYLKFLGNNWLKNYRNAGDKETLHSALAAYRLMVNAEDLLKNHHRYEISRLAVSKRRQEQLDSAMQAVYILWEKGEERVALEHALFFMEKSRAQEMQFAIHQNELMREEGIFDQLELKVNSAWISFYDKQIKLDSIRQTANDEAQLSRLETELKQWEDQYVQLKKILDDSLRIKYPNQYLWFSNIGTIEIDKLQYSLEANTAVVSFLEGEKDLYTLYIGKDSLDLKKRELDEVFLNGLDIVKSFLRNRRPGIEARKQYQKIAFELYQQLFAPIAQWKIQELILIPSPLLHDLPMEALLTQAASTQKALPYRQLSYLWQRYQTRYVEAASLLNRPSKPTVDFSWDYIGFAPDYSNYSNVLSQGERSDMDLLYYNQHEVSWAEKALSSSLNTRIYIEKDAKDSIFIKEAPNARIVHLSMHADTQINRSQFSYLLFDEPDPGQRSTTYDGKMYMYEIHTLPLQADLTILSACETGIGDQIDGEGIISLGRAFHFAGSSNVLMSLWKVDDYASSQFMPLFMKYIQKGLGKAEALQKARYDLIFKESTSNIEATPYNWAQYVLYGDNEPLPFQRNISPKVFIVLFLLGLLGYILYRWVIFSKKSVV